MKQGRATHSGTASTKVEPTPHAVNPAYPGQLGISLGNHADHGDTSKTAAVPMYEGRGLKAPMVGSTSHHCGSQGKHR
jgi:hypothetical protein